MDLSQDTLETLHRDGELLLCRGRAGTDGQSHPPSILVALPASAHPGPACVRMLGHA